MALKRRRLRCPTRASEFFHLSLPVALWLIFFFSGSFYLLSTVAKALDNSRHVKMMASLDHSMWFYDEFDASDWLLYVVSITSVYSGTS